MNRDTCCFPLSSSSAPPWDGCASSNDGLAEPLGPARWRLSDIAEPTLLALGERDAPIKRILRASPSSGSGAVLVISHSVELRRFEDVAGQQRVFLAVRSDLRLQAQVLAQGATWLDQQQSNTLTCSPARYKQETPGK